MELPGSAYLYTLATLAMTFAGFCAIVIVLRQTTGKGISGFHLVLTRLYLESGLFSAAFSMLPSLLALCGLTETTVWRVSSAIIATVLICFGATYPTRRAAITAGSLPSSRWIPIGSALRPTCEIHFRSKGAIADLRMQVALPLRSDF